MRKRGLTYCQVPNLHANVLKCIHSDYSYLEEKQVDAQGALGGGAEQQQRHVQHVPVGLHAHQQPRAGVATAAQRQARTKKEI